MADCTLTDKQKQTADAALQTVVSKTLGDPTAVEPVVNQTLVSLRQQGLPVCALPDRIKSLSTGERETIHSVLFEHGLETLRKLDYQGTKQTLDILWELTSPSMPL